jgi:hypothetical protein
MASHTIELGVSIVLNEIEKLRRQTLDGKPQAIRKKPHAIDVVFVVSLQHNYWFIILMET